MSSLVDWLRSTLGLSAKTQSKVLGTIATVILIWILRQVILALAFRKFKDLRTQYRWRKSATYIGFVVAVLIIGRIWFEAFQSISTFLGLLSAGLAIALRDPLVNLAGWVFIIWRRPFQVGDRVEIGNQAGDVIDLRIFQFTVVEIGNWVGADQSTGRIIHIPNGKVFSEVLANYSKGFQYIWDEIPVLITFESNWKKAKEILLKIGTRHAEHLSASAEKKLRQAAKKFMIFYTKLTPTVYTSVKNSGVLLTIRFLCEPRERRGREQAIWEEILEEFGKCNDIDFAYPTQRFYNNLTEGKPGSKPTASNKKARTRTNKSKK